MRNWSYAAVAAVLACQPSPGAAQPTGSVLIWPVDPVIEAGRNAAALWLENPGTAPILLQVRIFGWAQPDGENAYTPQSDVVGTPPMVRIEPGKRQLVRLTRTTATAANRELAYRVIIDEIPIADTAQSAQTAASVRFRMRYSLPLFSYGTGAEPDVRKSDGRQGSKMSPPLRWRTAEANGRTVLEIRNDGDIHARLVDVGFAASGQAQRLTPGLLGYVLPGAIARWPLPEGVSPQGTLVATVNGTPDVQFQPMAQ